jgi:hypothetical protein
MKRFIWTFTLRSYNYLLHNLTPHKLKTLSSLSCILTPRFFSVVPSPAVFCQSAVLSICLPQSFLALYSFSTVMPPGRRILTALYCTALPGRRILTVLYCTALPGRRILTRPVLVLYRSSFSTVLPPGRRIFIRPVLVLYWSSFSTVLPLAE